MQKEGRDARRSNALLILQRNMHQQLTVISVYHARKLQDRLPRHLGSVSTIFI
jgi:hypothetical protein